MEIPQVDPIVCVRFYTTISAEGVGKQGYRGFRHDGGYLPSPPLDRNLPSPEEKARALMQDLCADNFLETNRNHDQKSLLGRPSAESVQLGVREPISECLRRRVPPFPVESPCCEFA